MIQIKNKICVSVVLGPFFCQLIYGIKSFQIAEACLFLSEMYCLGQPPMDAPDFEKAEELRKYGMALHEYYRWEKFC